MSVAKSDQVLDEDREDRFFSFVLNEWRKIRSNAIKRFCLTYWCLKDKGFNFDLASLTRQIMQLGLGGPSRRTAYDYAHAIRLCEVTVSYPNPSKGRILGKIGDKAFVLSSERIRQLGYILRKKECTLSGFLEEAIEKEAISIKNEV